MRSLHFLLVVFSCFAWNTNSVAQTFTGKINYDTQSDDKSAQECLKFPVQNFTTETGENILVVFLNQGPEEGLISIEGFFQEVKNSCTKNNSTRIFMITGYIRENKDGKPQEIKLVVETGSDLNQKQAQEVLDFHNQARAEAGVEPLQWSAELSRYAQQWAEQLAQSGCEIEHRENSDKGENLYWISRGNEATPLNATKSWYSEIKDFKNVELSGSDWYPTGHYSQMVWKDTREMGMGMARCQKGQVIIVANYDPPGNYLGEKAY